MKANVESQTFNGAVEWMLEGGYFKLLTAAANCKVELMKGGRIVLLAPAVKRGFYQIVDFDQVRITNTGAQLTEFLTAPAEGGSDALTGSFDISSPLLSDSADAAAAAGATLLGVVNRMQAYNGATFDRLRSFTLGTAGNLAVSERGFSYGASSFDNSAAAGSQTILAPASNVNGVTVWEATIAVRGGAAMVNTLLAKTSAPASFSDGDVLLLQATETNVALDVITPRARFVAAGKGLYWYSGTGITHGGRSILYTVH